MSQRSHPIVSAILAELAIGKARDGGMTDAQSLPATNALLEDAAAALSRGIPARFEHGGKTFFLRVSVGLARLEVFDQPGSMEPLCTALRGSYETFGHNPGH